MTEIDLAAYARETYASTRIAQGLPATPSDASYDRLAALVDTDPLPVRRAAS